MAGAKAPLQGHRKFSTVQESILLLVTGPPKSPLSWSCLRSIFFGVINICCFSVSLWSCDVVGARLSHASLLPEFRKRQGSRSRTNHITSFLDTPVLSRPHNITQRNPRRQTVIMWKLANLKSCARYAQIHFLRCLPIFSKFGKSYVQPSCQFCPLLDLL